MSATRRRRAGVVVSAVSADGESPYWQTTLAAPLAAEPLVDAEAGQSHAGDRRWAAYSRWTPATCRGRRRGAAAAAGPPPAARGRVLVRGGTLVLTCGPGSDQVLVADLAQPGRPPRTWLLAGAAELPAHRPGRRTAWRPRRPARCICWIRSRAGAWPRRSSPGCKPRPCRQWTAPVGRRRQRRGDLRRPREALSLGHGRRAGAALGSRRRGGPGRRESFRRWRAWGSWFAASMPSGKLDFFQVSRSGPRRPGGVARPLVWGPGRVGPCVMLATDSGQLCCFDASGKALWQASLRYGPPCRQPAGRRRSLPAGRRRRRVSRGRQDGQGTEQGGRPGDRWPPDPSCWATGCCWADMTAASTQLTPP